MNEEFLWYLWKYQLFQGKLITTDGKSLEVQRPGIHNTDAGPDFFDGRIKVDGTLWAGNIEIHVLASDWYHHNHHKDPAYDNTVLHVVYEYDRHVFSHAGRSVPALELKGRFDPRLYERYYSFMLSRSWIACEDQLHGFNRIQLSAWLQRVMVERLELRSQQITDSLDRSGHDFRETFYQKLLRNFGFRTNGDAFEALARSLPSKILTRHAGNNLQLEALLFGQAKLLSERCKDDYVIELRKEYAFLSGKYNLRPLKSGTVRFLRMRPANFPTIRLTQFADLLTKTSGILHSILEADRLNVVIDLFRCETSPYWTRHYRFGKSSGFRKKVLGKNSVYLILMNTIIPFLFTYGRMTQKEYLAEKALDWLEEIPPEKNAITRGFAKAGIKTRNAMETQAVIQLKKTYCDLKKCLQCGIGRELLRPATKMLGDETVDHVA